MDLHFGWSHITRDIVSRDRNGIDIIKLIKFVSHWQGINELLSSCIFGLVYDPYLRDALGTRNVGYCEQRKKYLRN